MTNPTRYDHDGLDMEISKAGEWVKWDDYERLRHERDLLHDRCMALAALHDGQPTSTAPASPALPVRHRDGCTCSPDDSVESFL